MAPRTPTFRCSAPRARVPAAVALLGLLFALGAAAQPVQRSVDANFLVAFGFALAFVYMALAARSRASSTRSRSWSRCSSPSRSGSWPW